ncbi:MAG TPA: polysaccharide biosynthesis tyrosine autokinase [Planctomycetota bacterium]
MNNGNHAPPVEPRFRIPNGMEPEEGTSLLRTLAVLQRRGWILVLIVGISVTLAAALAFVQPRFYRSEATIEVGPDQPQVSPYLVGDPMGASPALWENHFRTQEALLRRPGLLAKVLEALPPEVVADYKSAPDPVRRLSEELNIDAIPSSFLIRIMLDHPTPEKGPDIVNKLVALFIEDSNRRLRELKTGALEILSTEALPVIRQKVDESEQQLQAFHAKMGFADLEGQYSALLEAKKKLWERLSELRIRRISIRHHPASLPEPGPGEASAPDEGPMSLEALTARRTELELELARQSVALKEKHPAVAALRAQLEALQELIRKAVKAEIRSRERELAAVDQEEKDLLGHEKELDMQISEARVRLSDYKKLEAEVAASRELYSSYLKKQGEVKATAGAGQTSVRVVDLARTPRQQARRFSVFLALGAVLGLLFGAAAVLVVEQIDDRIATPRQAEGALGLDLLTTIPQLPASAGTRGRPLLPEDDPVLAPLESFRRLRTEIVNRLRDLPGPKVVAVLSPQYGEGKSTVAINLARVLALEGRRVLLFDADLRRPRLKGLLANPRGPGLEEYLGGAPLERVVQATRIPGMHVVGAAQELPSSAEAPGSPRFRDVWAAVRSKFDVAVVDTSPVNAVSEVPVIAGQADASILVVEERRSSLRHALAAKRRLENHQIRILGLVVNRSLTPVSRRPWRERIFSAFETVEGGKDALVGVR